MKVLSILALSVIALTGVAAAGTVGSSNGVSSKMTGKAAASYSDWYFGGPTTCNETQHAKFETVSCTLSTPNLALAGTSGSVGWISDFPNGTGIIGTFNYTVSLDGLNYFGTATYP